VALSERGKVVLRACVHACVDSFEGESEPVSVCVRAGGNREDADLVGRGMQCIAGFPRDWTAVFAVAYVGVGCRVLRSMGPYTGAWVVIVNSGNVSSLGGGMQMLRVQ
jgi:hypothetical protein